MEIAEKNFLHMSLSKASEAISFKLDINTAFTEKAIKQI